MPLVEKIEHKKPSKQIVLEESVNIKKLTILNSSLVEKGNFYEFPYVIDHK